MCPITLDLVTNSQPLVLTSNKGDLENKTYGHNSTSLIFVEKDFTHIGGLIVTNYFKYSIKSNKNVKIYDHERDTNGNPLNTISCDLSDFYIISECNIDYYVYVNSINGTAAIFSRGKIRVVSECLDGL